MYIWNMKDTKEKKYIGLQLELDIIKKLKDQAKKEERNTANLLRIIIKNYLESVKA